MRAFVDTNVLVRHLTADPPEMAKRATQFLASATELHLVDLVVAETVYVLSSFYKLPRNDVAMTMRSLLGMPSIAVDNETLLMRTIDLYDHQRLDFADAYIVACAEQSDSPNVATFDKAIGKVPTVTHIAP